MASPYSVPGMEGSVTSELPQSGSSLLLQKAVPYSAAEVQCIISSNPAMPGKLLQMQAAAVFRSTSRKATFANRKILEALSEFDF